jgi:hypothetical protein
MTTPSSGLITTPSSGKPSPDAPCPCGHTADEHDAVASRYCRATAEAGLDRGCMCVSAPLPIPRKRKERKIKESKKKEIRNKKVK